MGRLGHEKGREVILEAAAVLFGERGFAATTMRSIADRAGCSVGHLYRHFAGKRALVRALLDREIERFERISKAVREEGLTPLATYRRVLEALSRHLDEHRDLVRLLTREALLRRLPECRSRLHGFRQRNVALLEAAHAAGELRQVDFTALGAVLAGATNEMMLALAGRDDPAALRRLPDLVFALIIDPLRERPLRTTKGRTSC